MKEGVVSLCKDHYITEFYMTSMEHNRLMWASQKIFMEAEELEAFALQIHCSIPWLCVIELQAIFGWAY